MRWEELTIADFEEAVERCESVCVLPIGVIEAHGPHLPLGTDAIIAHRLACAAAETEPAIVFPFYPWGLNVEAKVWPGGVVLRTELLLDLLANEFSGRIPLVFCPSPDLPSSVETSFGYCKSFIFMF